MHEKNDKRNMKMNGHFGIIHICVLNNVLIKRKKKQHTFFHLIKYDSRNVVHINDDKRNKKMNGHFGIIRICVLNNVLIKRENTHTFFHLIKS